MHLTYSPVNLKCKWRRILPHLQWIRFVVNCGHVFAAVSFGRWTTVPFCIHWRIVMVSHRRPVDRVRNTTWCNADVLLPHYGRFRIRVDGESRSLSLLLRRWCVSAQKFRIISRIAIAEIGQIRSGIRDVGIVPVSVNRLNLRTISFFLIFISNILDRMNN